MAMLISGTSAVDVTDGAEVAAFGHAGRCVEIPYSSIAVAGTIIEPHLATAVGSFGGRISITHEARTMRSPEGWFNLHDEFTFFFAFRLRRILDDAGRLGYIPGLRVNFREYGLDDQTAAYIKSLAEQSGG